MNTFVKFISKISTICLCLLLFHSCSSQRDTGANRGLQNLSARYNYIYNSNILLNTYQEELARNNKDNYDNFLPIYIAPSFIDYMNSGSTAKDLDDVTTKAQAIIVEKNLSNYIDDAYILLGKTNFYNGSYFNALAYFDYTAKAYKSNKKIYLKALNWKARSIMGLNDFLNASKVLDTVKIYLDSVKSEKAESLATLAQMSIYKNDYKQAISYLKNAIKESRQIQSRTRWAYILAQLYEREKEYKLSLRNYTKVENSNAPFEMYFNAKLSKIRIKDALNILPTNRNTELLKLLKDDKNLDYTDQIYYEVAEDYYADSDFEKAISYYQLSAQKSTINQFQKGLSYLKIAELNFKDLKDYTNAKLYYDSASINLPKNYPNYESIVKKGQNLEYLTERYQLISKQDTLQSIARLNEKERHIKVELMFDQKKEINLESQMMNESLNNESSFKKNGIFYFNNLNAISKGFSDFKKKWGNRTLEDNWRQSVKSSSQINQQNQNIVIGSKNDTTNNSQFRSEIDKSEEIKNYLALLPLTAEQLSTSNQKIIDAYFEIAGFYQQELNDQKEAIKIYELLLQRFPQNNHLETIYYSLYLGYKGINETKANTYKNIVLSTFPNSIFAKTILDPNFSFKQNTLEEELNNFYNNTFEKYIKKDFAKVISSVDEINQRFPNNNLQAQYDYLKAIAIGRTQNVDELLAAFNKIIVQYPDEELINPLVKDHIVFINANLKSFKTRSIALLDVDPLEPPFIKKQAPLNKAEVLAQTKPKLDSAQIIPEVKVTAKNEILINESKDTKPIKLAIEDTAKVKSETIKTQIEKITNSKNEVSIVETTLIKPLKNGTEIVNEVKDEPIKVVPNNIFSLAESKTYFYVIAVADVSLSMSSSRFGVGQFNRGVYADENLKHQLIELEKDQLIYVGDFANLKEVKAYAEGITNLLPKIMKVPLNVYNSFYISKENFNKLKNKETINQYIEFFKKNY